MSDWNIWYIVALFGLILFSIATWTVKTTVKNPKIFFLRHIRYHSAFPRGWLNITRLQLLVVILVFAANCMVSFLPSFFPGWEELQRRLALAATVNMAPLCLGGRAPVVDSLNVPRSWYQLMHFTLGFVATIEFTAHAVIAIALRPRPGLIVTYGWAARICAILCIFMS